MSHVSFMRNGWPRKSFLKERNTRSKWSLRDHFKIETSPHRNLQNGFLEYPMQFWANPTQSGLGRDNKPNTKPSSLPPLQHTGVGIKVRKGQEKKTYLLASSWAPLKARGSSSRCPLKPGRTVPAAAEAKRKEEKRREQGNDWGCISTNARKPCLSAWFITNQNWN